MSKKREEKGKKAERKKKYIQFFSTAARYVVPINQFFKALLQITQVHDLTLLPISHPSSISFPKMSSPCLSHTGSHPPWQLPPGVSLPMGGLSACRQLTESPSPHQEEVAPFLWTVLSLFKPVKLNLVLLMCSAQLTFQVVASTYYCLWVCTTLAFFHSLYLCRLTIVVP